MNTILLTAIVWVLGFAGSILHIDYKAHGQGYSITWLTVWIFIPFWPVYCMVLAYKFLRKDMVHPDRQ